MEVIATSVAGWIVTLLTERWIELLVLAMVIALWRWFMGVDLKRDLKRRVSPARQTSACVDWNR